MSGLSMCSSTQQFMQGKGLQVDFNSSSDLFMSNILAKNSKTNLFEAANLQHNHENKGRNSLGIAERLQRT